MSTGPRAQTGPAFVPLARPDMGDAAVLQQGVRNANDGLSDLQIKDGALDNMSKLLDRLAVLATQAASGQTTQTSRNTLNAEFLDVLGEITRESNVARLDVAGATQGFSVFVSSNGVDGVVAGTLGDVDITSLGLVGQDIATQGGAQTAVATVTTAITNLGIVQGQVGQLQNRLSYAISLAQSQIVNTKGAESRIRDANVAEESANLTRYSILNQSGIAALAQANQSTSAVLALLRG